MSEKTWLSAADGYMSDGTPIYIQDYRYQNLRQIAGSLLPYPTPLWQKQSCLLY